MFLINTAPAQAAREKGYARYPDDFPHLAPGEQFVAWQSGSDWEIETTLNGHALAHHLEQLTDSSKKGLCMRLVRYRCRNGQVEFLWSGGIAGGSETACQGQASDEYGPVILSMADTDRSKMPCLVQRI